MRSVLVLCFTVACVSALSAPGQHSEVVSGRVVAYSVPPECLNGIGYWSMLVRVQPTKERRFELIRADFSLPCDKFPEWVSAKPAVQKFRLIREKECDAVLAGSMGDDPKQDLALPIWKYPPGAEHVTLPFGRVLPCYRSVDLPLVPVV
jgi:hypothetical protein